MEKYKDLAKELLKLVGGEKNVTGVTHCLTRLRFTLKDDSQAQTEVLKTHPEVTAIVRGGGQYQIVIGNHVADVYDALLSISDLGDLGTSASSTRLTDRFITMVSAVFQPALGVLAATGMLKGVVAIMAFCGLTAENSGIYLLLQAIGDGFFQFLPIVIAISATKYFNLHLFTGIALAATLLYPGLNADNRLPEVLGFPIYLPSGGYYQTVLPIIMSVALAAQVEKFFKKIVPDVVKYFMVPFLTLIVVAPLTILGIGPAMIGLSNVIGDFFHLIYQFSPVLMGAVLGGLWQLLVMFGLHWGLIPLMTIQLQSSGFSTILAIINFVSFSQFGSVLALAFKLKNPRQKNLLLPSVVSAFFGVTEPAIYGLSLPLRAPFILSSIGGAVQGAFVGWTAIHAYNMGGLGIFALTTFVDPNGQDVNNFLQSIIAMFLATLAGFILTLLARIPDQTEKEMISDTLNKDTKQIPIGHHTVFSPLEGTVLPLEIMPDPVFASGAMGEGVAVRPTSDQLVSPVQGIVTTIFPTKHALTIRSEDGVELLIHLGIDTVHLDGQGFTVLAESGQEVRLGQPLLQFDREHLEAQGYDLASAIIVTNSQDYMDVLPATADNIKLGQPLLTVIEK
ncbi:beta-glucoside-specific PTS transporter subunit IIABC [Streptococcus merionis]|uniref:beta-glucoside-specific PTS transporter subunit IIABC n=1 Tax=Streptococcus merionis TaxID=400065 RepID=UPI0035197A52